MEEYLIKNTTREQREQIVKDSLGYSELGCDDAMDGYDMYLPYIEGNQGTSWRSRWNIRRSMCVIWSARSAGAAICTRNGAIFPSKKHQNITLNYQKNPWRTYLNCGDKFSRVLFQKSLKM